MKNPNIAKVLKEYRKQNDMTVHDVSVRLSSKTVPVADKTIYGWESGQAQPDADTFLLLCEIYNINDILGAFGYQNTAPFHFNSFEKNVVKNLRQHPEMLPAVKKILDLK